MNAPFDILIAPDGRIFVHNLTPALAAVLAELNPGDETMRARSGGQIENRSRLGMKKDDAINDKARTTNA
jgi:hypothetical protein